MGYIFFVLILCAVAFYLYNQYRKKRIKWKVPKDPFPEKWRIILRKNINFYNALSQEEKNRFEFKIQEFILNYEIIGVRTSITIADKLLVASSAIIPIFGFDDWRYCNLHQVLIYPTMFNENFETEGADRKILGMVGNGYMEGTMILSQEALIHGFKNDSDKKTKLFTNLFI